MTRRLAHRYVPIRFILIILQMVFTVMLYLDRERSLYAGMAYAETSTTAPRSGYTVGHGRSVVVAEYSKLQINDANRDMAFLVGAAIACLNVELFGFFTGYSLLSPLVSVFSIFLHACGCLTTFMTVTDGWYYPYFWFTLLAFTFVPTLIEVFVIGRQCLCNIKLLRFIDLRV